MSSRDDSSGLAIIAAIGLGAVGIWVHFKVRAFSTVIGLNTDTTYVVLQRLLALFLVIGLVGYIGLFKRFWTFLGFGFFICMMPALSYWSVIHITDEFALDNDPAWYGKFGAQVVIAIILLGIGVFFSSRDE